MGINRFENGSWKEVGGFRSLQNGEWQTAVLKRFDGAEWEQLWPCHFSYTKQYSLSSFMVIKGKSAPAQVSRSCLVTGSSHAITTGYIYDSLLFFSKDEMSADLAGSTILKASLQLRRLPKQDDDGQDTAYVNVGYALSKVDPAATDNTWSREFTVLTESGVPFVRGQTQDVPIGTAGVSALLSGEADCLCLPTTREYTYVTSGYALLDPESTILTVTYSI